MDTPLESYRRLRSDELRRTNSAGLAIFRLKDGARQVNSATRIEWRVCAANAVSDLPVPGSVSGTVPFLCQSNPLPPERLLPRLPTDSCAELERTGP